jgi:hypothetical protein
MRKTFICIVGLCLLFGTAALFAQGGTGSTGSTGSSTGATTAPSTTTTTTTTTTHKGGKKGGHKAKSASGDVVGPVDPACATIVVKPKKGDNWTFTTDGSTTYWINKAKAACSDVKADQHVTVWYKADGDKKLATKVQIHEKKAKPAKTTG